ncbi:MAG: hypothetical protein JNL74_06060 [Fibrobacteres bacterium]|nr:hypothetical protein [Fibrobacterota bacterium]
MDNQHIPKGVFKRFLKAIGDPSTRQTPEPEDTEDEIPEDEKPIEHRDNSSWFFNNMDKDEVDGWRDSLDK